MNHICNVIMISSVLSSRVFKSDLYRYSRIKPNVQAINSMRYETDDTDVRCLSYIGKTPCSIVQKHFFNQHNLPAYWFESWAVAATFVTNNFNHREKLHLFPCGQCIYWQILQALFISFGDTDYTWVLSRLYVSFMCFYSSTVISQKFVTNILNARLETASNIPFAAIVKWHCTNSGEMTKTLLTPAIW